MSEDDTEDPPLIQSNSDGAQREVVVPLRLYKTVTVFSTLIAVFSVVGGFILVDVATNRASAPASEIDVPVAIGGVGLIPAGNVGYLFSSRFSAERVGETIEDASEPFGNG